MSEDEGTTHEESKERPPLTAGDAAFIKGEGEVVSPGAFEDGVDLENLWEDQVNDQEVKKMESELLLPAGTYLTVPGAFKKKDFIDEENGNRRIASFFGSIIMTDPETGKEVKGARGYRISPDRRNKIVEEDGKQVDTGKPDFKSALYVQAVKAYTVAYGEAPNKVVDVFTYLTEFPHRVRVIKTKDNSNLIVAISAVIES